MSPHLPSRKGVDEDEVVSLLVSSDERRMDNKDGEVK